MTPASSHDVVVVGAGASGLQAARELASDHDVLVVDAGDVGAGASGHAAGFVSVFEDWAAYPEAVAHAADAFERFDGTEGFAYHRRPYVEFVETAAEAEALRAAYDPLFDREGYAIDYLDADAVADRFPGVFDVSGFHGALVKPESGVVDAAAYARALAADARDRGVEIRTGAAVDRVRAADGAVTGVDVDGDHHAAEAVVVAAGASTAGLVSPFVSVPTRRFVYCNVRVRADGVPAGAPMGYGRDVWWRPEPELADTLLVSGGMYFLPEERPPRRPPSAFFETVAERLPGMTPVVDDVQFVTGSDHTCPQGCAVTPDALPVLDAPEAAPDGLVVVAGVTGGISMSPVTGRAVRALLTADDAPLPLSEFRLDRFDDPAADFRVHGIQPMPSRFPTGAY